MSEFSPPNFVSVIVPAYNSAGSLRITLKALQRQTYPAAFYEVIVVDDGSTDTTPQLLRKDPLPTNFRVIRHSTNRGLASARNTGIRLACGDLLIFLDADMEAAPDFIALHVQRHQQPQTIGVLSAILPASSYRDKYQRYLYTARRGAKRFDAHQPLPFQVFVLACTSVKRAALASVGVFAENLTTYGGEDTELAYRLWRCYPEGLFYAPDIKVTHHHYRPLSEALTLMERFGREGVPYIVQTHPELAALYFCDYLPGRGSGRTIKRIVGAGLIHPTVRKLLWQLYRLVPYPLSNPVVRLAMAAALLKGLSDATEDTP